MTIYLDIACNHRYEIWYTLSFSSRSSCVFMMTTIGGQTISWSFSSSFRPFHLPNASPAGITDVPFSRNSSSKTAASSLWSFILFAPFVLACVIKGCRPRYQSIAPGPPLHAGQCHCLAGSFISSTDKLSKMSKNFLNQLLFLRVLWLF